jgi:hypothetical protein
VPDHNAACHSVAKSYFLGRFLAFLDCPVPDIAIAIACLRFLPFPEPLRSWPCFFSCMTFSTSLFLLGGRHYSTPK